MRYLCLIHGDAEVYDALPQADQDALVDAHLDYDEHLRQRGHLVSAEALQGPEATRIVRMRDGVISATDGPFAETKEQIGGFYLIEAQGLDEAIAIAGHIPAARLGSVEVRPIRDLIAERDHRPDSGRAGLSAGDNG